jgi:DNA-binding GntR family transcriptional regulator
VQQVQDLLRDAIVRLELAPGAEIDKVALCNRLGVSRFPVSEALGRLAAEGFVEVLPQRGTRVARIDLADCEQAMFIRRALETEAVRAVAASASEQLLAAISSNLREQRRAMRADDRAAFHDLDLAFHSALLDALGFERVKHVVDAARANLDRARLFLCTPERQAATFAEHERIAAALRARDEEQASQAMEAHLDAVMDELTTFAAAHPEAVAAQTNSSPSDSKADASSKLAPWAAN